MTDNVTEEKEFPKDILGVIREFSRPKMQFVNEWAAIQRDIEENDIVFSVRFHADVKAKLFTPEADQYMAVFIPYMAAVVATDRFSLVLSRFPIGSGTMKADDWADYEFWKQCNLEAMHERHKLYDELSLMLYGPPKPWIDSDDEYE